MKFRYYFFEKWKVDNEYKLEGENENYRIDRLMVDEENKIIFIVDYKTGLKKEKEQLEKYKKIINEKLNENNMENYKINTKFEKI